MRITAAKTETEVVRQALEAASNPGANSPPSSTGSDRCKRVPCPLVGSSGLRDEGVRRSLMAGPGLNLQNCGGKACG